MSIAAPILQPPTGEPLAEPRHLKALHAAARSAWPNIPADERHEMLRVKCQVPTLALDAGFLTKAIALKVLEDLNEDRPQPRRRPGRFSRRPLANTLRLSSDAQRTGIEKRLRILGWPAINFASPHVPEAVKSVGAKGDWRDRSRSSNDLHQIIRWLEQTIQNNAASTARRSEVSR